MHIKATALVTALLLSTPASAAEPTEYSPATQKRISEALAQPPPTASTASTAPASAQRTAASERYRKQLILGSIVAIGGSASMLAGVIAHRDADLADPAFANARKSFGAMLGIGGGLVLTGLIISVTAKKPPPLVLALIQGRGRF